MLPLYIVTQEVAISTETEGTVDIGSVSRLKFSGSSSEGVSIKICVEEGGVIVYGSYSNPNPSPALNDFMEELREISLKRCLTAHFSQDSIGSDDNCNTGSSTSKASGQNKVNETSVYVTIEGFMNASSFTVISDPGRTLVGKSSSMNMLWSTYKYFFLLFYR